MNRLVIVGNGFDLAHGLKTSYEDFLVDYFNTILSEKQFYEDELIRVKVNPNSSSFKGNVTFRSIKELLSDTRIGKERGESSFPFGVLYLIHYKSKFFLHLLKAQNWTDIESCYFNYSLSEFKNPYNHGSINIIIQLNKEFDCLKLKLGEYLKKVDANLITPTKRNNILNVLESFFNKVNSKAHKTKLGLSTLSDEYPEKVYFVNFNYTSLLKKYIDLLNSNNQELSKYIPIHGSVDNIESIIFGYGDETHEEYKFLENQDKDDLLVNIKSFYYPAQPYYQELMDFINAGNFDVYVIGHSLGLSDRVLCKSSA